jgi:hypothetical protein
MSQAVYLTEDGIAADRFRPRLPGAMPSALLISLAAAAIAMGLSGTAIAWRWAQYDAIDTAEIAYQSPQQVSLPPEDFAGAQVIHGRLVVLTQPVYAFAPTPQNVVPLSAKVESSATVEALERDSAMVDQTVARDEARHDAEFAPDTTISADPGF